MASRTQSSEDYLETILILRESLGNVRSIDIVNHTGYTKPSISVAMKKLRNNGYINMDKSGYITLTPEGELVASETYKKHCFLKSFFMSLGVSEKTAEEDACKIEHEISRETIMCILKHQEDINKALKENEGK